MRVERFDFVDLFDDVLGQNLSSGLGDEEVVFDAHPDAEVGEIQTRLIGDDASRLELFLPRSGVMGIQADMVGHAMEIDLADVVLALQKPGRDAFGGKIFDRKSLQIRDG